MKISKLDLEPTAIDFLTSEGFEKLYSTPEDATKGIPFNPDNFAWSGLDIEDAKKKWST